MEADNAEINIFDTIDVLIKYLEEIEHYDDQFRSDFLDYEFDCEEFFPTVENSWSRYVTNLCSDVKATGNQRLSLFRSIEAVERVKN